ncbi:hypothetical protein ABFS83_08G043200 [Erythranthe nasuta]
MPPLTYLPYRIENCLHDAPITYYQKDSSEPETLGARVSTNYVWDNLSLPHKLVVQFHGTLKLISKFTNNKGFSGTKRYFGDRGKTLKTAGSNVLFAAVTEVSDSVLKGAETSGFNGMV